MADSWPGLLSGPNLISGTAGLNLPIAGFIAEAQSITDIELLPILWCAAEPCSYVEDEAFEQISEDLISGIKKCGHIDGIYLDLHGAMVTQSYEDGEGELLRRLRVKFGNALPIVISLDLHANISTQMVELATSMSIFRTYPHLDMAKTGARCVSQLMAHIKGVKLFKSFRQVPYLIPLHAQYTGSGPCQSLYQTLEKECVVSDLSASIALGFTASDIYDSGPSIVVYAENQGKADEIADRLLDEFLACEDMFACDLLTPTQAVRTAMDVKSAKPVIIADVQDNPGAGATSDTTSLLKALVDENATEAVLGLLHDPAMAECAHRSGLGEIIEGPLGGKSGMVEQFPFCGRFRIESLSDGRCKYTGEMYGGGVAELGLCAVLKVLDTKADIRVVISSNRSQCLDQAIFTHIGISLSSCRIICVKSTVHYRADFEPIAFAILETAAPGVFLCDLSNIEYMRLRKNMRIGPCGEPFVS